MIIEGKRLTKQEEQHHGREWGISGIQMFMRKAHPSIHLCIWIDGCAFLINI
jgi:hypothetical protein